LSNNLQLKIGDFGISKQINNANKYVKTQVGTLPYMAPEKNKRGIL
jgi:serine/threonine protein kinase